MGSFFQIEPPASWQLALLVVVATFLSHQGKPSRLPLHFSHCPFELNIAGYQQLWQSVNLTYNAEIQDTAAVFYSKA